MSKMKKNPFRLRISNFEFVSFSKHDFSTLRLHEILSVLCFFFFKIIDTLISQIPILQNVAPPVVNMSK